MLRVWRYLWVSTVALLSLLLILLFTISQLDLNRFKDTIETQVTELTGRQLTIDGSLQIDFSLQPMIRIEKVSFANAPWGKQPQMLSLKLLQLKIRLLPLLKSKLVVEQLLLDGVEISIETNKDGQMNWQLEKLSSEDETADSEPFDLAGFQLPVLKQLQFSAIQIYYLDAVADIETDTVIDNLQLTERGIDRSIRFSADGTVNEHPVSFSGSTGFLTTVTTQKLMQQAISLQFNADVLGITLSADGTIQRPGVAKGIDIKFTVQADDLDKSFTDATGKSIHQHVHNNRQPIALNFSAIFSTSSVGKGDSYSYNLNAIQLKLADNDINGNLSFLNSPDHPDIVAKLYSKNIDLNQLLPEQSQELKESTIKNPGTKSTTAAGSNNTGNNNASSNSASSREKTTLKLSDKALPFELLKSLDAELNYSIDQFQFEDVTLNTIQLDAALHDGLLQVKQLDLSIEDTPMHNSLTIDSRTETPTINTTVNINKLPLNLLSQALQIKQSKTIQLHNGTLDSSIKLNTRGNNINSLVTNLKGNATIQLADVDLEHQLNDKKHNAKIRHIKLGFTAIDNPLNVDMVGTINGAPLLLSGQLDSAASVINNDKLKLNLKLEAVKATLELKGYIIQPLNFNTAKVNIFLSVPESRASAIRVANLLNTDLPPESIANLPVTLRGLLTVSSDTYRVDKLQIKVDKNDISGDIFADLSKSKPNIVAKLNSKNIDLNQLLPEQSQELKESTIKNPGTKSTTAAGSNNDSSREKTALKLSDEKLPFELLKSLDTELNYSIDQFQFENVTLNTIQLDAALHDGLLQVKQLDLSIEDTPMHNSLTIDSRTETPTINTIVNFNKLPLKLLSRLLQIKQSKTIQLHSGTLNSGIKLNTWGNSVNSLVTNLKGNATIQLADVDLEHQLNDKKYNAEIKHIKLGFTAIDNPLNVDMVGTINGDPLLLSAQLDSTASVINNDKLKLSLKLEAVKATLNLKGYIIQPLNFTTAKINIFLNVPESKETTIRVAHFLGTNLPPESIATLPATLRGLLTVSSDTYRVDNLHIMVGNNDLSGDIFADLSKSKPNIVAKLESRLLDLNNLVPATIHDPNKEFKNTETPQATDNKATKSKKGKIFSDEALPALDVLDQFNFSFRYKLNSLISNNQKIDKILLNLTLKDSLLKIDPFSMDLAKGTLNSTLELNVIHKPHFRFSEQITKLDYGNLFTILGLKKYAKGTMDAEINLTGEGNSVAELMANLNGTVRATTVNGELDGSTLKLLSKDIVSIIPFSDTSDRQKINCGVIQYDINKGIASTHAMVINTGAVSALGTGDIDLANEKLSLYVAPRSKRTSIIKLALVPVNITGPLSSPTIKPDVAGSTISTTKTATNISLTIATGGIWLLAEGLTNDLWDKFIDDTDYCARALAGKKIVPRRILLQEEEDESIGDEDSGFLEDEEYDW